GVAPSRSSRSRRAVQSTGPAGRGTGTPNFSGGGISSFVRVGAGAAARGSSAIWARATGAGRAGARTAATWGEGVGVAGHGTVGCGARATGAGAGRGGAT